MDAQHTRWNNATRVELRRLVSHALPPSDTPLEAFGPWAAYVEPLRAAHAQGVAAVRDLFITLVKTTPNLGRLLSSDPQPEKELWSTADLLSLQFEPLSWVVPDILPVGLATLAGRPKLGKSWLALQIAIAAGTGGCLFGRPVEHKKVLYIALEDGKRRLVDRLTRLGVSPRCDVWYAVRWPPLNDGGLARLDAAIRDQAFRLVIVDTLSRALGNADQLDLAAMNALIGSLHDLADDTAAAILTIDHHKKPTGLASADPIDDIMGSTGKSAMVDAALGLYRERGRQEATLKTTGRDFLDVALALTWNPHLCRWHCAGEAGQVRPETIRDRILTAIRELDDLGQVASTVAIARHLGADKGNVSHELAALLHLGHVVKGHKQGRIVPYHLVADPALPPTAHLAQPSQS